MSNITEVEHPYYMREGCYYKAGNLEHYDTWKEYFNDWKDSDDDMNLLWRFDFKIDEESKEISLDIFYIMQRKAYTYSCHIKKIEEKELKEIEKFLKTKAKKIIDIWAPFLELRGK
jgi:protein associated with RNAse G/E